MRHTEATLSVLVLLLVVALAQQQGHVPHVLPTTGWYANTNPDRAIVVDSRWSPDPQGKDEALIQLMLALVAATSRDFVYVSGYMGLHYNDKWVQRYGSKKLVYKVREIEKLQKGDILIINEGITCPHLPEGALGFVYMLASYRGCKSNDFHYISHNHYGLAFENLHLPKERLIHPYVNENITLLAHARGLQHDGSILYSKLRTRDKKANLVLIDDDVPESVKRIIDKVTKSLGGQTLVLTQLNMEKLIDAYDTAKVVFDWCMRGSERCVLEASLFGALAITNRCETGGDFHDMPIPARFIVNHTNPTGRPSDKENEDLFGETNHLHLQVKEDLTAAIAHAFQNYWDLVDDFEPVRKSILSHTPASMLRETVRFLATVNEKSNESGGEKLMPDKCIGC